MKLKDFLKKQATDSLINLYIGNELVTMANRDYLRQIIMCDKARGEYKIVKFEPKVFNTVNGWIPLIEIWLETENN